MKHPKQYFAMLVIFMVSLANGISGTEDFVLSSTVEKSASRKGDYSRCHDEIVYWQEFKSAVRRSTTIFEDYIGGLYGANLVSNPSFEDYYTDTGPEWVSGDSMQYALQTSQHTSRGVQGWSNVGYDVCSIRTDGPTSGYKGDYYGMGGRFSGGAEQIARMRQDINLLLCGFQISELDSGTFLLNTGAYLSSWPGDTDSVGFAVLFLDDELAIINTAYQIGQQNQDRWTEFGVDRVPLPPGTRFIRFEVEFMKAVGTNNDGRIDDVWVRLYPAVTPEPLLDRNLLVNPGFEAGSRGWNMPEGNPRARFTGIDGVPAHTGDMYLFGGQRQLAPHENRAVAIQDIELSDYGFTPELLDDPKCELYLQSGGWLYSWGTEPAAQASVICTIFDENGHLLDGFISGRVRSIRKPLCRRAEILLPTGARMIRFCYDTLDPSGVNLDGYLDDAWVIISLSPHCKVPDGPLAIAHRGNSIVAPENTVSAVIFSRGMAHLVEFDVRKCASGELVIMHDETVVRTTEGSGTVSQMTLAELRALDAGSWFSSDFFDEQIPTLTEMLQVVLPEMTPLIERKSGSATDYVNTLIALNLEDEVIIQSFDWEFLTEVHSLNPEISLAALGSGELTSSILEKVKFFGASIIAWFKDDVTETEVLLVNSTGIDLFVWTVNDLAEIDLFVRMGVDGIISDDPASVSWMADPFHIPGDLNEDGCVDLSDLNILLAAWGCLGVDCPGDCNGDGMTNQSDLGIIMSHYGKKCYYNRPRITASRDRNILSPPGYQAENGENKPLPAASEQAGLLDIY